MRIAIGGAGIAGLAAAAFLARAGHRVCVYDKAPQAAPVGSGLIVQPTGQAVLHALAVGHDLIARGARLDRLDGRTEDGRRILDVRYDALGSDIFGVAIHRAALFGILYKAAANAGAEIQQRRAVIGADLENRRFVFADGEKSEPCDLLIDALGLRTPFVERNNCGLSYGALWGNAPFPVSQGFSANALSQRYRDANVSAGLMPIGTMMEGEQTQAAFFWTLGAKHYDAWLMTPLHRWKDKVLKLWPEAAPALDHFIDHEQFVFATYAHHTAAAPVEGRLVHIGDSWHAASPQLGQGANMALLDAWALSKALERHEDVDAALAAFVETRRNHVKLYQAISWLFTPVYQSDSKILPALRDKLAEPLSRFWFMPKLLAAMVAGTLGRPLKELQ
ncbi:FAD-dependent oxidoreductase [Hyphococcus sp.]|uniref:FAD-dependent oxidoreductase n=1 Tax=Hyphococcus sp. TaxID=2038636 RepID=UPI003D1338A7